MFDDIGLKIKNFAKVASYIFAVIYGLGGFITAIVFLFEEPLLSLIIFAGTVAAILINWIFFALMYGFGELIENSDIIAGKHFSEEGTATKQNISAKEKLSDIKNRANDFLTKPIGGNYEAAQNNPKISSELDVRIISPDFPSPEHFSATATLSGPSIDFSADEDIHSFSLYIDDITDAVFLKSSLILFTQDGKITLKGDWDCLNAFYDRIKA